MPSGCESEPLTPEETVEEFHMSLNGGECEKALELSTGNMNIIVQMGIDIGCEEYKTSIDSTICFTKGKTATCDCYGQGFWFGDFPFHYSYRLDLIDGTWKVSDEIHPEFEDHNDWDA